MIQKILLFLLVSFYIIKGHCQSFVMDIDGNKYKTVIINNQVWMAENLRTTKYNDGSEIPYIQDSIVWKNLTSGAYCWYNNNDSNANKYGALYNWYAVETNKLCPVGWHIPSDEEWKILEGFVDSKYNVGDSIWDNLRNRGYDAGLQLKSGKGWKRDQNGSDRFGFSALPGGERCSKGRFFQKYISGFWWTSSEYDKSMAWYRNVFYDYELIYREIHPKFFGFSVRCVKD
jgi:uncharacterized protein (TIGR02145 family)